MCVWGTGFHHPLGVLGELQLQQRRAIYGLFYEAMSPSARSFAMPLSKFAPIKFGERQRVADGSCCKDKSVPHWSMTWLATHLHLLHATWRGGRSLETDVEFGELVLLMMLHGNVAIALLIECFTACPHVPAVRLIVELGNLVVPVEC